MWLAAIAAIVIYTYVRLTILASRFATPTVSDELYWLLNGQVILGRDDYPPDRWRFFYPIGYGFITAAADVVGGTLSRAFHISLVINVVLALLMVWCLVQIGRRLFDLTLQTGLVAGAVTALLPGVAATTTFAWAESLAQLSVCAVVLSMLVFLTTPTVGKGIILGVVAGVLPAVHGRLTLLAPIALLLLVVAVVHGKVPRVPAAATSVALFVSLFIARAGNAWLKNVFYPNASNRESGAFRKITNPSWWDEIFHLVTGHTWYVLASSFGVAAVGAYVLWRAFRTSRRFEQRHTIVFIAMLSLAILATSAIGLASATRADIHIYGRYVDSFAPIYVFAGVAGLLSYARSARIAWLFGAILIVAVAAMHVVLFPEDRTPPPGYGRHNVLGLELIRDLTDARAIWPFAVLAGAFAFVVLVVSLSSMKVAVLGVALLLAWGTSTAVDTVRPGLFAMSELEIPQAVKAELSDADIGFDVRPDDGDVYRFSHAFARYRFMLHPGQLRYFNIINKGIPEDINCVVGFVDREPPPVNGEAWQFVASDDLYLRVLWQRPGMSSC